MGLLRGGKISSRTQTVINSSKPVVNKLKKLESVTKIVIGLIKPVRNGRHAIRFKSTGTSIEITVKGNREVQTLFAIGPDLNKISHDLGDLLNERMH